MNNPALPMYASQSPTPYAYSSPQNGAVFSTAPGASFDYAQTPFPPGMVPNHLQKPSHPQQIPQHLYQQHLGQAGPFPRPESRSTQSPQNQGRASNGPTPVPLIQGAHQPFNATQPPPQPPSSSAQSFPSSSAPAEMNMAANMGLPNPSLVQQAQIQNAAHMARAAPPSQQPQQQQQQQHQQQQQQQQQQSPAGPMQSPQSAARERARVTVLLEINTQLLQEVVSLQGQGKAGSAPNQAQQSPTSPTSATDTANALNNSPGEPPKSAGGSNTNPSKPPSQEYADCMRRLQANLSYLAAIADAKKKVNGALPPGPAIMAPPAHLPQVHELYKKLNALFPEAGQSAISKAVAYAASQTQGGASKAPQPSSVPAQG